MPLTLHYFKSTMSKVAFAVAAAGGAAILLGKNATDSEDAFWSGGVLAPLFGIATYEVLDNPKKYAPLGIIASAGILSAVSFKLKKRRLRRQREQERQEREQEEQERRLKRQQELREMERQSRTT